MKKVTRKYGIKKNDNGTLMDNGDISCHIIELLTSNKLLLDPQSGLRKELSKIKLYVAVIHHCNRYI